MVFKEPGVRSDVCNFMALLTLGIDRRRAGNGDIWRLIARKHERCRMYEQELKLA